MISLGVFMCELALTRCPLSSPLDGYEFWNERTLVTIFSAP